MKREIVGFIMRYVQIAESDLWKTIAVPIMVRTEPVSAAWRFITMAVTEIHTEHLLTNGAVMQAKVIFCIQRPAQNVELRG